MATLAANVISISQALQAEMAKSEPQTLYSIVDHLSALYESVEGLDEDDPLRGECIADIARYEEAEIRKVDGICRYLAFAESQMEMEADEAKRHQSRKQTWEKRIERLESSVQRVMAVAGTTKFEGRGNTLLLKANPPSVEVTDQSLVPQEYIRTTVTEAVDKSAAKHALKTGESIPGLSLTVKHRVVRK